MIYDIAYKHFGKGCGVFRKEFKTPELFREWLDKQFPTDEAEFKLIGLKQL